MFRVQVDPSGKGEAPGRVREWQAALFPDFVVVRHQAVDLAAGEEFDDYPETYEMSWAEWEKRCADYGLTVEGKPL